MAILLVFCWPCYSKTAITHKVRIGAVEWAGKAGGFLAERDGRTQSGLRGFSKAQTNGMGLLKNGLGACQINECIFHLPITAESLGWSDNLDVFVNYF